MIDRMSKFADTPDGAYYAVIFTSQRTPGDDGYGEMADEMAQLVSQQPGFLGAESVRGQDGFGITISYWDSLDSIDKWKAQDAHRQAQTAGREKWYEKYSVRVMKLERQHGFNLWQRNVHQR